MSFKRLNTILFFIGVFATAFVIQWNYLPTIDEALGAALADLVLVWIAYMIVMRIKKGIINKVRPKSKQAIP